LAQIWLLLYDKRNGIFKYKFQYHVSWLTQHDYTVEFLFFCRYIHYELRNKRKERNTLRIKANSVKKNLFILVCLASAFILFSCIVTPQVRTPPEVGVPGIPAAVPAQIDPVPETQPPVASSPPVTSTPAVPPETTPQGGRPAATPQVTQPAATPERIVPTAPPITGEKPRVPEYIMSRGIIPPKDMAAFLLDANPDVEKTFIEDLAYTYIEECAVEGVNADIAFAQMCLETGFLRFGGLVSADMNNFCGLGATGPDQRGLIFPNPRMGVRAHIQHLKAYASEEPLKQVLVDPRFHYVRRGSSPAINGLAGTWAADRAYADKIRGLLERMYTFYYQF